MSFWYFFFGINGIGFILILIFGLPRKKSDRKPSMEGIDNPDVAKAFERMSNLLPFKLLRKKVISQIKKHNPLGKLIDVGCGTGNLIIQIARELPELDLVGIDISTEILEYAKNRALKEKLEKTIEFKTGTVEKLPFPDKTVDFIVSMFSLHHWINPTKAFEEIVRVLKDNGTGLIFDFRRDSRKLFYGFLTFITKIVAPKALKRVKEPLGSIQASFTPEEVRNLLSQINIQNIQIKPFLAWMFISIKK